MKYNFFRQRVYERHTGVPHNVTIDRCFIGADHHYEVKLDEEFYSTAETRAEAYDEVADIFRTNNYVPILSV